MLARTGPPQVAGVHRAWLGAGEGSGAEPCVPKDGVRGVEQWQRLSHETVLSRAANRAAGRVRRHGEFREPHLPAELLKRGVAALDNAFRIAAVLYDAQLLVQ